MNRWTPALQRTKHIKRRITATISSTEYSVFYIIQAVRPMFFQGYIPVHTIAAYIPCRSHRSPTGHA
jgi:hypothetical protein